MKIAPSCCVNIHHISVLTATLAKPKVSSVNSWCQKNHYQRQYKCDAEYLGFNEVLWVFPSVFGCKIEVVPYCVCFQPDFHTVQPDLLPIHCLLFLPEKAFGQFSAKFIKSQREQILTDFMQTGDWIAEQIQH